MYFSIYSRALRKHYLCPLDMQRINIILRYISVTIYYDLHLRRGVISNTDLSCADLDTVWEGYKDKRVSITGFVVRMNVTLVYCWIKQQTVISHPSGEVCCIALSTCAREVDWPEIYDERYYFMQNVIIIPWSPLPSCTLTSLPQFNRNKASVTCPHKTC